MDQKPGSASIGREAVEHVSALASLALTPEEAEQMSRDLGSILDYVAELQQVNTAGIEPLTQVSELFGADAATSRLRSDEPHSSLLRARVMESAPASDGTFFKVPKVIER